MKVKIGITYRWCLGYDFYRDGTVVGFDIGNIVIVRWVYDDGIGYVRLNQLVG